MALYFETSVSYSKIMQNGAVKKVTEKYLFDSLTFSEAEARTIEELTPYISGEFSVKACRKTKIAEIFFNPADKYWLVCVGFITVDEKTATEKRSISQILVQADDFESAVSIFKQRMSDTIADYEIVSVSETPYLDVYPATPKPESENADEQI